MKSVGKQLQEARLSKNWTPELAARETKIKIDRLRDLEADDYSHFTSPAYARGFVRTYARALGLNEYQLLRQLDNKLPDDDTPNLVSDSNVGYLPETAMPPRVAHRDFTGLYVLMGLGFVVLCIFGFVLFKLYQIGELRSPFGGSTSENATADTTSSPSASTNSVSSESTARALPVDSNTPPPAVAVTPEAPAADTNAPSSVRALPVNPSELAGGTTNAAPNPNAPVKAIRALPVDPSELTNAPSAVSTSAPAPQNTPGVVPTTTTTSPRALPVDLNEASVPPAPAPAVPAAPVAPVPTVTVASLSARQSNSGPVRQPPSPTSPVPNPVNGTTPAATPDKRLVLIASQDSFVRVTSQDAPDGDKPLYASVLRSGQSIGFDGRKFSINVGVPAAVNIKLDGVNYGPHSDQETPETFVVESHQP